MLPPICEVCDLDFRDELKNNEHSGGLVRFADYKELPTHISGHPKGLAWFCAKHIRDAKQLSSFPQAKAVTQLLLNDNKNSQ